MRVRRVEMLYTSWPRQKFAKGNGRARASEAGLDESLLHLVHGCRSEVQSFRLSLYYVAHLLTGGIALIISLLGFGIVFMILAGI